jgi:hypothetical protein
MPVTRIVQLADGEELISFEVDERAGPLVDNPRLELLEHRRAAEAASERGAPEPSETPPNGRSPACDSTLVARGPGDDPYLTMVLRDAYPRRSNEDEACNRCFTRVRSPRVQHAVLVPRVWHRPQPSDPQGR